LRRESTRANDAKHRSSQAATAVRLHRESARAASEERG